MTTYVGDNLEAARAFSDRCLDTLSGLMTGRTEDADERLKALTSIQDQATDLRARSIRRAASLAIEDFTHSHNPARRSGSLLALNKLVHQYTQGLNQIAPCAELHPVISAQILEKDARDMAAAQNILAPLRSLAKPGSETAAISALLNITPESLQTAPQDPADHFDVIMPGITSESLRKARHSKKSVSISYASDDIFLNRQLSTILETALTTLCVGLVERSVEVPLRRQNQGLSGTAHIAITARRKAGTFDLIITGEGPIPNASLMHHPNIAALSQFGVTPLMTGHETLTRIDINGLPFSVLAPASTPKPKQQENRTSNLMEAHA